MDRRFLGSGGYRMKRVARLVYSLMLTGVLLVGCSTYVSKDAAMDVAVHDLGLIQINVSNLEGTLDETSSPASYTVTFDYAGQHYVYVIDAKDKNVISKNIT